MHYFMVHTADLLYLKPYSEQAKQLEAECLAEGHAASGCKTQAYHIKCEDPTDRPQKLHLYVYIIKGC